MVHKKLKPSIMNTEEKYEVVKYFDDHYERVVKGDLTKQEADDLATENNKQPRAYVVYYVRRAITTQKQPQ